MQFCCGVVDKIVLAGHFDGRYSLKDPQKTRLSSSAPSCNLICYLCDFGSWYNHIVKSRGLSRQQSSVPFPLLFLVMLPSALACEKECMLLIVEVNIQYKNPNLNPEMVFIAGDCGIAAHPTENVQNSFNHFSAFSNDFSFMVREAEGIFQPLPGQLSQHWLIEEGSKWSPALSMLQPSPISSKWRWNLSSHFQRQFIFQLLGKMQIWFFHFTWSTVILCFCISPWVLYVHHIQHLEPLE